MNIEKTNWSAENKPKVLGTGLIALDVVLNADHNREPYFWAGGTCGNVLTILSFLGWQSFPVARLNGDTASQRVLKDFKFWNVALDFAATEPTAETPIIIHTISRNRKGEARHRFSFNCPHCGAWLPSYKPVLASKAKEIATEATDHKVFFFDRASRSSITLAQESAKNGALVVFEPVSVSDPRLFQEALSVTHILKYSRERFRETPLAQFEGNSILLEIQTLGEKGLRYRSWLPFAESKNWLSIESRKINQIKDTAGAGDWCSAGIIDYVGRNGLSEFYEISANELKSALIFGENLGAWNCQFEGARGGMYQLEEEDFELKLKDIISLERDKKQDFDKVFDNIPSFVKDQKIQYNGGIDKVSCQLLDLPNKAYCY